jgi:hypothetical protein
MIKVHKPKYQTNDNNLFVVTDSEADINENDFTLKDNVIIEVSFLGQDNGDKIIYSSYPLAYDFPDECVLPYKELKRQYYTQLAMDKLKTKWDHLYRFGNYPLEPYPTNFAIDLNEELVNLLLEA